MDILVAGLNARALRVAADVLAASLAFVAARHATRGAVRNDGALPAFWYYTAALLLALALAREIDLASRIAGVGRGVFDTEGWYAHRRRYQTAAILLIVLWSGLVALSGCWLLVRRHHERILPGFVALDGLLTFLAVRALSLHQIDALLYRRSVHEVRVNALVELTMTCIVALTAVLAVLIHRPHAST